MKLKPSLFPAILFIAVLAIQLLPGCAPSPERSRLEHIESIIDEHPDSAMALLDSVDTAALRSDRDRALYDLLYNLALYKSFNDSLDDKALSIATDYFWDSKDYSHAATSLYLQGNLYSARKEFGKAAVYLTRGSEAASKAGDVYREGLCAMSMWGVYGKILDTNRQIAAAKKAVCAFDSVRRRDWKIYAMLNLASAYNNNGQYDSAMVLSHELLALPEATYDSTFANGVHEILALCAFSTNKDSLSLAEYAQALRFNDSDLSSGAPDNISLLLAMTDSANINEADRKILIGYLSKINRQPHFAVLAKNNDYKEAYKVLNRYRVLQDSMLRVMMTRSVDSSIEEYHRHNAEIYRVRLKISYILWGTSAFIALLLITGAIIWIRHINHRRRTERMEFIQNVNTLTETLKIQTNRNTALADNNAELSQSIKELLSSKLVILERLCSAYSENEGKKIAKEIKGVIDSTFSTQETIDRLSHTIDRHAHNLCSNFKRDFPDLKERDYHLFIYSVSGLTAPAISIILGESKEVIYNRKSRLKVKIKNSGVEDAEVYLSYMN